MTLGVCFHLGMHCRNYEVFLRCCRMLFPHMQPFCGSSGMKGTAEGVSLLHQRQIAVFMSDIAVVCAKLLKVKNPLFFFLHLLTNFQECATFKLAAQLVFSSRWLQHQQIISNRCCGTTLPPTNTVKSKAIYLM